MDVVDGFMDWLFGEDPESREFAELEQAMYRHHFEGGTGAVLWSIMQQAMRQDLGLYVLAVTTHPSGQTTLVTHNLPTDATQYRADISFTGEPGDLRFAFARPEVRLHSLKVSTSWVDVRDDCHNLTDLKLGSWADLALSNAKATEFPAPAFGGVHPGGACICARRHHEPGVQDEKENVLGEDREKAAWFVAEIREKIIAKVKRA